jgi:hypothetical protein
MRRGLVRSMPQYDVHRIRNMGYRQIVLLGVERYASCCCLGTPLQLSHGLVAGNGCSLFSTGSHAERDTHMHKIAPYLVGARGHAGARAHVVGHGCHHCACQSTAPKAAKRLKGRAPQRSRSLMRRNIPTRDFLFK